MGKQRHSEEKNLTDVAKISQGRLCTRDILVDTKRLARERKGTINTQWEQQQPRERLLGSTLVQHWDRGLQETHEGSLRQRAVGDLH